MTFGTIASFYSIPLLLMNIQKKDDNKTGAFRPQPFHGK
jgi:hypothetical protein